MWLQHIEKASSTRYCSIPSHKHSLIRWYSSKSPNCETMRDSTVSSGLPVQQGMIADDERRDITDWQIEEIRHHRGDHAASRKGPRGQEIKG